MVSKSLVALALVGVVDSISYMVVAPSLVFYVLDNGGTKEQYGLIMSIFSFSAFCTKPLVGHFSDVYGFRIPYFLSLSTAALGGLLYLIANMTPIPIVIIFLARLLGGIGAASSALGFAYLAKVVPHEEQTKTNSILSMTRIIGMTIGPGLNVFLNGLDFTIGSLHVNYKNSAGMVLILSNLIAFIAIAMFLAEPHIDHSIPHKDTNAKNEFLSILRAVFHFEILLPMLSIFTINANFQLIETALAPAANHALGWTPVEVSALIGGMSFVIFTMMAIVIFLSARKTKDMYIMMIGCVLSIIGYTLIWNYWQWQTSTWNFLIPVVISASAFPFLGAPTRSCFTKAVDQYSVLKKHEGTMQALLGMFASVGGFVAPGFVATYVLRTPDEVENSSHHRELGSTALFAPILMLIVLLGCIWIQINRKYYDDDIDEKKKEESSAEEPPKNERTKLLKSTSQRSSRRMLRREFSSRVMVHRRSSMSIVGGMVQQDMFHYDEHDHSDESDDDDDDEGDQP